MNLSWFKSFSTVAIACCVPFAAMAQEATPGYPERVIRWQVEGDESCADVAEAVYGSASHRHLVNRYNNVPCGAGTPLKAGKVLVLPEKVTQLPTAVMTYVNPDTRARPSGGSWRTAQTGQELGERSEVNTHESGMAGIQFADATRLFLSEHTLVVIYETAGRSSQASTPPKVSLKSGELQAGLSALAGRDVLVELPNNASVKANSTDTVVRRDAKKTNISVFDGSAEVRSAGAQVVVPKNFGSKVIHSKPPEKPRPLPPAPKWSGSNRYSALAADGHGTLRLSWEPVQDAKHYRIELSRTEDFQNLVLRERLPADVRQLRAENFPAGDYYARVRAIDSEDFMGVSSSIARLALISAKWKKGFGTITQNVESNLYSTLLLEGGKVVRVAIDGSASQTLPLSLDLGRLRPKQLLVSVEGRGGEEVIEVSLAPLAAELSLTRRGQKVLLQGRVDSGPAEAQLTLEPEVVLVTGSGDELLRRRLKTGPKGEIREEFDALAEESIQATLIGPRGELWAQARSAAAAPPPAAREEEKEREDDPGDWIRPPSSRLGSSLFSARLPRRAELRGRWSSVGADSLGELDARLSARYGAFLAEAEFDVLRFPESALDGQRMTVGLGWRFDGSSRWTFAPAIRSSLFLDGAGTRPIVSPLLALSGQFSSGTWASHLAVHVPTLDSDRHADQFSAELLSAYYHRVLNQLWIYAQLDAHGLMSQGGSFLPRGGLGSGLRWGSSAFVSAGLRATPWVDVGEGTLAVQLAAGITLP